MNERIKKLARQAREQTEEFNSVRNKLTTEEWAEIYNEKFAELIVKECADAIINDRRLSDVRSAANGCVRTIKEHFGVGS